MMIQFYKTEFSVDVGQCYNNLGDLFRQFGDLEKAKVYFEKSLQVKIQCYETEFNMDVAKNYNNLGILYK